MQGWKASIYLAVVLTSIMSFSLTAELKALRSNSKSQNKERLEVSSFLQ